MGAPRWYAIAVATGAMACGVAGAALGVATAPDGSETARPSTTTTRASSTTSTSSPSTTAADQPMTLARLRSATLPEGTCGWVDDYVVELTGARLPKPLRLVGGEVPGVEEAIQGSIRLEDDPIFTDLDGDGATDAVAEIWCSAGGSGNSVEIIAFGSDGGWLGSFVIGDDLDEESRPDPELRLRGRDLTATYNAVGELDASCCGRDLVIDRYRWSGGTWTRTGRTKITSLTVANQVVEAANRADRGTLDRLATPAVRDQMLLLGHDGTLAPCDHESGEFNEPERTCVFDDSGFAYELVLTSGDAVGEWTATAVNPLGGGM